MLHNSPALQELSLFGWNMGAAGAGHLVDGLSSKNSIIKALDLRQNKLGAEEAGIFATLLLANQKLKVLVLNNNNIGNAGVCNLAIALRQNDMLQLLDLEHNGIKSNGTSALAAAALVTNKALKDLDLRYNPIGDDGATSIAEMLTRNESIERIWIGGFGEKGLSAFVTCLSRMSSVKDISFDLHVKGFTCLGNWHCIYRGARAEYDIGNIQFPRHEYTHHSHLASSEASTCFEPWWMPTPLHNRREHTAAQLLALYPSKIFHRLHT